MVFNNASVITITTIVLFLFVNLYQYIELIYFQFFHIVNVFLCTLYTNYFIVCFKYTCLTIRPAGGVLFNWGRLPIPPHQFLLFNKEILRPQFS